MSVKIEITVDKTAAIQAGHDRWGHQEVLIDLAELADDQRGALARRAEKADGVLDCQCTSFASDREYPVLEQADLDGVRQVLGYYAEQARLAAEKDAKRRAEGEAKAAQILADWEAAAQPETPILERWNDSTRHEWTRWADIPRLLWDTALDVVEAKDFLAPHKDRLELIAAGRRAALEAERQAALDEREAEREADRRASAQAAAERQQATERRQRQIKDWVAEHGTPTQQAREKRGLLSNQEIVDAIKIQAFEPLASFERYERLKASDVCVCEYGDGSSVEFDVDDADDVSDEEFRRILEIETAMPDGTTVTPRLHVGDCPDCEERVERIGIRVEVTVGELEFSREYAAE